MWDYISKIKSSANKETLLVELKAASGEEKTGYQALYDYLKKRNRSISLKIMI